MTTQGWGQTQTEGLKVANVGERLREQLRERIEAAERKGPSKPTNMSVGEILALSYTDVYMAVRMGEWTIDDFVIWGTELERFKRRNP